MRSRLFTCERTVCSEMKRRFAISSVAEMLVEQKQHLELARRERRGDRVGHAGAAPAAGAHLLEQSPRDRAGERGLAVRDAAQESDDALRRLALQQVAGGTAADRAEQVLLRAGGGQDDDLAARRRLAQPRRAR